MAISYNKLWKLLVDKKMSKADLRKAAGIAPNTMTRLRRDEEVTLAVLNRICVALDVNIGDVMEFTNDERDRWHIKCSGNTTAYLRYIGRWRKSVRKAKK